MKRPWLTLAALVALVGATAAATMTEEHQLESARAMRRFPCYRPGCYSSISGMDRGMELQPKPTLRFQDWQSLMQQELHLEEKPTEETFLQRLQVASLWDHRAKRNARKAPPARRRGKQREGARPVCRGCYSGLTIVASPAQEGKNESLKRNHSESSEDSSAGY